MRAQYRLIHGHAQETKSTKMLNDGLLDEDGWSHVANWLADEGFRQLANVGVQAVAWVLPRHPAAFHDTMQVLARLRRPLVDTFTDAQAAYDWLLRWPTASAAPLPSNPQLLAANFVWLPAAEQVNLASHHGRALTPQWEPDFYVKPYELPDGLVVEVAYHLHSGLFHQVRIRAK